MTNNQILFISVISLLTFFLLLLKPFAILQYDTYTTHNITYTTKHYIHNTNNLQLPLSLLKASTTLPLLVELKSGTTYNGRLSSCDTYMNINLRDVVCTSKDGEHFTKLNECYIRGSSIKYLRLPEEAVDRVLEEEKQWQGGGRGGRGRGEYYFV